MTKVSVFGEVLFDCFPNGENVLGGAAFNVAWHLQALGDAPKFISAIGNDTLGQQILVAMDEWGMDTSLVQRHFKHPTGQVSIEMLDGEPHYDIKNECAYDFIAQDALASLKADGILYHGTLALRHADSRAALDRLIENSTASVFLDVNLRTPWWQKQEVYQWMRRASWIKLNQDEARSLGFSEARDEAAASIIEQFKLEQLLITCGAQGAYCYVKNGGVHHVRPEGEAEIVDPVGAGDAFSAVFIHGLLNNWEVQQTLDKAQHFAQKIIGIRGATPATTALYHSVLD